jgi:hypothetical protein
MAPIKPRHYFESLLEFLGESFRVVAIREPPGLFMCDVLLGRYREANVSLFQRERSSRRIASASTRRPAFTRAFNVMSDAAQMTVSALPR